MSATSPGYAHQLTPTGIFLQSDCQVKENQQSLGNRIRVIYSIFSSRIRRSWFSAAVKCLIFDNRFF